MATDAHNIEVKRGKAALVLTIPQMRKAWYLLKFAPESKGRDQIMNAIETCLAAVEERVNE